MLNEGRHARSWWIAGIVAVCGLACIVPLMAVWGISHDLAQIRTTLLQSETARIRSHAIRTVGNIQDQLHMQDSDDLMALLVSDYPRSNWDRFLKNDPSRLYAAVLDPQGEVVLHFHPDQQGKRLRPTWYTRTMLEGSDEVVETDDDALTGGRVAYDVRLPIYLNDAIIGYYHSGLDRDWLESLVAEKHALTTSVWTWLLLAMLAFEIVAGWGLFYASRRIAILQEATKVARTRRLAELGQLMAGIVHEIRNPLNAMRLNLHVLTRTDEEAHSPETLEAWDVDRPALIQETKAEIDRVEGLLKILLSYARPDVPRPEILDPRREIHSTLTFLRPLLERREMSVVARLPESPVRVEMDRDRFRQVILNLLNNACDAMQPGGAVQIDLRRDQGWVEIRISDDGEGIPPTLRERIFDPFFSTKETGTGLGLAIVRRHLDDARGTVGVAGRESGGTVMLVRLPLFVEAGVAPANRLLA